MVAPAPGAGPGTLGPLAARRDRGEATLDLGEHLVVTQRARGGDHHRAGSVVLGEERPHVVGGDGLHVFAVAGRVAAQRVALEQRGSEPAMSDVVGRVVVHGQFLQDDLALTVHIVVAQRRPDEHVTEQLDAELVMPCRQPAVVRGVLLGRECIEVATAAVDTASQLLRTAGVGALEQQMFQEVADPAEVVRLVARADTDPDTGGHRQRARHAFGGHREA